MNREEAWYSLGIDTSNYRTSMALVDNRGNILCNVRRLLEVPKGKRGLRQSEALFQHIMNLQDISGEVLGNLTDDIRKNIVCVSASNKPRPVEGSYMPVFNGGISLGKSLAAALGIDYYEFSHQEGHIEAIRHYSVFKDVDRFVSFHFSGGTTEAILVDNTGDHCTYEIVGGSKDIALGQLIDRVGVSLGINFPCGEEMDQIACAYKGKLTELPKIKTDMGFFNLSGIETRCQQLIGKVDEDSLIASIFSNTVTVVSDVTEEIGNKYDINDFIYAGGVSSSEYLRENLKKECSRNICFGSKELSGDNAVGIALLGGKTYGHKANQCNTVK
jgi:N6-L-threonylcarbamoyladenine synthase